MAVEGRQRTPLAAGQWERMALTGHGSDEGTELILILPQLYNQQSAQCRVERCATSSVQVTVGNTKEWEMLRLKGERGRGKDGSEGGREGGRTGGRERGKEGEGINYYYC